MEQEQLEHRYVDALGVLVSIEGAGKFARACALISQIWGISITQVIADAATFA